MDLLLTVFLGPILILVINFILSERKRHKNVVNQLPGPRYLPLFGTLYDIIFTKREDIFDTFKKRIREHGRFFRTWLGTIPEIQIMKPEHLEVVMNSSIHIDKGYGYQFLEPWLGKGLLLNTGKPWQKRRKLLTPSFHFKILEDFFEVFVENSQKLTERLERETNDNIIDIYPYINFCALDIICETAMGVKIDSFGDSNKEYVSAILNIGELFLRRVFQAPIIPEFILNRTAGGKKYLGTLKILHDFTTNVIKERKNKLKEQKFNNKKADDDDVLIGRKRLAFLDLLLEASEDGNVLSDTDIREEVDTFLFEGHDTTTIAISWCLFLLGHHQDVQNKILDEIESIVGNDDRPIAMSDIAEMKYLDRVIKESLRLYPSVPMISRMITTSFYLDGQEIPPGTSVSMHIYETHHDPAIYPDPDRFDPDRFLPEACIKRHPFAFVPFSGGPRNCIGQKFATLEEKIMIAYIVRKFKLTSIDPPEKMKIYPELVLRPQSAIRMKLEIRK